MVKTLVLVRHGVSERGSEDMSRELTRAGQRALSANYPHIFGLLGAEGEEAEIWTSPALRALETAEIVAEALDAEGLEIHDSLYDQDLPALQAELEHADAETLVLVGHAPFLGYVAETLLGFELPLTKGAVCAIDVRGSLGHQHECVWKQLGDVREPHGKLLWLVSGPSTQPWETLDALDEACAHAATNLEDAYTEFRVHPEDPAVIKAFRFALRGTQLLTKFFSPLLNEEAVEIAEPVYRLMLGATTRLREIDCFSDTVADLMESGELSQGSKLVSAVGAAREAERDRVCEGLRKKAVRRSLRCALDELFEPAWSDAVLQDGLSFEDITSRFDYMLETIDARLFGLDMTSFSEVHHARREVREVEHILLHLSDTLGEKRANYAQIMQDIDSELSTVCTAQRNISLVKEWKDSMDFRDVTSDLAIVSEHEKVLIERVIEGRETSILR